MSIAKAMRKACTGMIFGAGALALAGGVAAANEEDTSNLMSCAELGTTAITLYPETAKRAHRVFINFMVEPGDVVTVSSERANVTYRAPGSATINQLSDGSQFTLREAGSFRIGAGALRASGEGSITVDCAPGAAG
ncbi:MAG: hypothetical protein AAF909_12010 [Pseudomonadota bacterium]